MGKDPIILKNKKNLKQKEANKQTNKNRPLPRNRISIRATMLYPMSCGEILSLLVTSGARTARKTCTQSIRKNDLYGQNMTFSQKVLLFY